MSGRRRWTDEIIQAELTSLIAELGRMPTRTELTARGMGGLWSALSRRGGIRVWRERMAPLGAVAAPADKGAPKMAVPELAVPKVQIVVPKVITPPHEHIAVCAFFLYERGGAGDHVAHWLQAERELMTAGAASAVAASVAS
jgi:hypothetical protein